MKKLLIIFVAMSLWACKKDNPQPKDNEPTPLTNSSVFKVIEIDNSQPLQIVITDSLNYNVSGALNECSVLHNISQLDVNYHVVDVSNENTHIASFNIQEINGVKSIVFDWKHPLGYFTSQTITDGHCGSNNDVFDFSLAIRR